MLRAPKFFHVFVGGALSPTLVCIHHFRQNLRTLALDPTPRWAQRNRHQNRQHHEQRLGCPERQENLEEKTLHFIALLLGSGSVSRCNRQNQEPPRTRSITKALGLRLFVGVPSWPLW